MKCLTVKQPWAELIACGQKTIELRTWHLKYRGPLVIIASAKRAKSPDAQRWEHVEGQLSRAVALVELVDCFPAQPTDAEAACSAPGPRDYAWQLRLVRRLDIDLHVKGQLSIYDPPPALRDALEKELSR